MKKTTITHAEYLQIIGLQTLGRNNAKRIAEIEEAINELLGVDPEDSNSLNVSDLIFDENRSIEWLMERSGVRLEDSNG